MKEIGGSVRYVNIVRRLFIIFCCVALPALMICLVFCFLRVMAFWIITPVAGVLFFVVYGFYTLRVSLGTVIAYETTEQVVHLKTRRRTFTYDVKRGCVAMAVKGNRYIGTFQTQDSRDKFVFYRRAPFSKISDAQFTADDIASFFPRFAEADSNDR